MVATYCAQDIEDLVGSVNAHVIAGRGGDQVFMLTGPDGTSLAGNIPARSVPAGWATLRRPTSACLATGPTEPSPASSTATDCWSE